MRPWCSRWRHPCWIWPGCCCWGWSGVIAASAAQGVAIPDSIQAVLSWIRPGRCLSDHSEPCPRGNRSRAAGPQDASPPLWILRWVTTVPHDGRRRESPHRCVRTSSHFRSCSVNRFAQPVVSLCPGERRDRGDRRHTDQRDGHLGGAQPPCRPRRGPPAAQSRSSPCSPSGTSALIAHRHEPGPQGVGLLDRQGDELRRPGSPI